MVGNTSPARACLARPTSILHGPCARCANQHSENLRSANHCVLSLCHPACVRGARAAMSTPAELRERSSTRRDRRGSSACRNTFPSYGNSAPQQHLKGKELRAEQAGPSSDIATSSHAFAAGDAHGDDDDRSEEEDDEHPRRRRRYHSPSPPIASDSELAANSAREAHRLGDSGESVVGGLSRVRSSDM